jgi:hypothetical protein
VPLVLRVTNTGDVPVTLQLMGRTPTADFHVADAQGAPVWTRLRGKTMLGALRLYPLDPGNEHVFRAAWNGRTDDDRDAPPGEYLIHGVLLTDDPGGLASSPVRLRIDA